MEASAWTSVVPSGRAPNQEFRSGSPDSKWDLPAVFFRTVQALRRSEQGFELEGRVVLERVTKLEGRVVEVVGKERAVIEVIGKVTLGLNGGMHFVGRRKHCGCHGLVSPRTF